MELSCKKRPTENSDMADNSWWNRFGIWVENAPRSQKVHHRMGIEMKTIKTLFIAAWVGCFSISALCGASLKTWRDAYSQYENERMIPAKYLRMSLKQLGEQDI